jgi:hypothetical protein
MKTILCTTVILFVAAAATAGVDPYPRAGWQAEMPPGDHLARGTATIIDERTIQVDNFWYDNAAPEVYFYLGAHDLYDDFFNGIPIGERFARPYLGETIVVQLDVGETLDGYGAISVWCVQFNLNFTSGHFYPPGYCPGDLDEDDIRDLTDFSLFAAAYGSSDGDPNYNVLADLTGDGVVDLTDFTEFAANYQVPCP